MGDGPVDTEGSSVPKVGRRGFFRIAGGALGALAALWAGGRTQEASDHPTQDQIAAAAQLDKPDVPNLTFQVPENDPDILRNGGLTVRNEPKGGAGDPTASNIGSLPPGKTIIGIPWEGKVLDKTLPVSSHGATREVWVAFKGEDGKVGFVDRRYLLNITPNNNPVTSSPQTSFAPKP